MSSLFRLPLSRITETILAFFSSLSIGDTVSMPIAFMTLICLKIFQHPKVLFAEKLKTSKSEGNRFSISQ